ncbi:MAG TPA: glycosyltransferase family 39 protein [Polyangiaceae bacterium]
MEARERRVLSALLGVLLVALVLRLAYIAGQRGDLLFDFPVVDEERYVAMGRDLAAGKVPDAGSWFHPPGLAYALAVIFHTFGPGLLAPRVVQALLSTASCGLAFVVARRLFSTPVALATAAVCAVHGVLVFESYELLPPTWMLAADMLALWLLLRAGEARTPRSALSAGVALGIAGVFGPTVLPFALFAAAWLRKPALAAALVLGVALPIAPVAWGNWERGHEVVLVSTNGGINFFLGNDDTYPATLDIRPGEHWAALEEETARAGIVGGARSSWFYRKGLAAWERHPARAVGLVLRKLYLFFDGPEIPRDTDIYAMRGQSSLLGLLVTRGPPWWPDGVMIPLALVGVVLCMRERGTRARLLPVHAFVGLQALVLAAFFVTSRYRVPSLPVLAMLACAGVERAAAARAAERAAVAAGFVALALLLNVATRESSIAFTGELDFYRGLALVRGLHRPGPAVDFFRRAAEEDPTDGRIWFELGNALDASGRPREAVDAWTRAGDADPWDARGRRRASVTMAKLGDLDGAIAALRANVESRAHPDAFYAQDHLNLALLYARRGMDGPARDELAVSQAADPVWFAKTIGGFARSVLSRPDISASFREAVEGYRP